MGEQTKRYFLPAAFSLCLIVLPPLAGAAQDICVHCTEPERIYQCQVEKAEASADNRALSFFCVAKLADEYGHRTCAVVRKRSTCTGVLKTYVYDPRVVQGLAGAPEAQRGEDVRKTAKNGKASKDGPPDTLVGLTKETARETGEVLGKAGRSIGGAAEKAAKATAQTSRKIGESVRDALSNAGKAVDQSARKTLKCIGSAFEDCFN